MSISVTDLFCGGGGSTTGLVSTGHFEVVVAANHWQLALDSHGANHPAVDHKRADIHSVDPRTFPRTDVLWASPECTNHSRANGRKRADRAPDLFDEVLPDEASERSRATMWDVVRFSECHRYQAVMVENVVDALSWEPFPAWLMAMESLGYEHHIVCANAMFAQAGGLPAPQSRDRIYVVFWRKGNRRPDFGKWTRPRAYCEPCGEWVTAVQAWKPGRRYGTYRAQYVWRCPKVSCRNSVVEPGWLPAAAAIDWSDIGVRIGDRARPLAAKTVARIEAGLKKFYGQPFTAEAAGHTFERRPGVRTWHINDVLRTLHTTASKALLVPAGGTWNNAATSVHEVMRTRTTRETEGVLMPAALLSTLRGQSKNHPVESPMTTVSAGGIHHGLLVPYYSNGTARTVDDPHATMTTRDRHALVTPGDLPRVEDCHFRMLQPAEIAAGMAFPKDYVLLGVKREQVRQAGNAVCPPAARDIGYAVAESLGAAA